MYVYELTERVEQLASNGLPPPIKKEFLQLLVGNPGTLSALPTELQHVVALCVLILITDLLVTKCLMPFLLLRIWLSGTLRRWSSE